MKHNKQGPMENWLDGLDEQSGALSLDELKEELRGRGIDIDAVLREIDKIVSRDSP